ncbi:hypothetical protein OSTOST_05956 [Ostertagia ostertagi]
MKGLVDYGSDSGSGSDDEPSDIVSNAPAILPKITKVEHSSSNGGDDSYFAEDDVFEGTSSLNLPAVIEPSTSATKIKAEGELEDMVKPKEVGNQISRKGAKA